MLIDAVALSLQRRVIRATTGTGMFSAYKVQKASDAVSQVDSNLTAGASNIIAGGEFSSVMQQAVRPTAVRIAFPHTILAPDLVTTLFDDTWLMAETSVSAPNNTSIKCFHGSQFTTPTALVVDPNQQALCDAVTAEYLAWLSRHYDVTYAGISTWQQTGCDDYMRWEFARRRDGSYSAQTRVVSMPPNFGCDNLPIAV